MKSADRLYSAAKEAEMNADEERCYILFMRFLELITSINKLKVTPKDKEFAQKSISSMKTNNAFETLEAMTTSLKNRYSALKESEELRAKQMDETNEKQFNDNKTITDSNNSKQIEVNNSLYPLIDCQTIVEELENCTEMTRILIFDTRDANDYNESHIDRLKTTADLTVANLPKESLTAGLTASKLEKILPLGNVSDVYSRRRQMSKIIILDDFSQEVFSGTPAFNLAEALWKVCLIIDSFISDLNLNSFSGTLRPPK